MRRIRIERLNMTQVELGELLGVSDKHVSRMENGAKAITQAVRLLMMILDRVPAALKLARTEIAQAKRST